MYKTTLLMLEYFIVDLHVIFITHKILTQNRYAAWKQRCYLGHIK